jgi:hypothetical protein
MPHAQFLKQAALFNNGRKIGLLRGAGTRMATFFYCMHRILRQRRALLATIHSPQWANVSLNARGKKAVKDIEDPSMFKGIYFLLRAVFPALRALRLADSNRPGMDKIFFLSNRTSQAIINSEEDLADQELFPISANEDSDDELSDDELSDDELSEDELSNNGLEEEVTQEEESESVGNLKTTGLEDEDDDGDSVFSVDVTEPNTPTLGWRIAQAWKKRRKPIESDFAVTGWALCVMADVREDVAARLNGTHRRKIERVVEKLYAHDVNADMPLLIDTFWNEFK